MDVSTAMFTHCWVGVAAASQNTPAGPEAGGDTMALSFSDKGISRGKTFSYQLKGVDTYMHSVNHVYQCFMNNQSLPVWACRRVSSGLLCIVLNQHVIGFFSKRLPVINFKDQGSTSRFYFQSLIGSNDYKYLVDPVDVAACKRVVGVALFGYELRAGFSVVASVAVGYQKSDAQKVIDIVYETSDSFSPVPRVRKSCLRYLYRICGHHDLPPREMQIELNGSPGEAKCRGGYGIVFKSVNQGLEVAVKALMNRPQRDPQKIVRMFYKEAIVWKSLHHPNVVPLLGVLKDWFGHRFAMVSEWMTNGSINAFVKAHEDVNRFKLLADAARGLIYLHGQGIIHGDLKGDNILVDGSGNARLADFGLITFNVSDEANTSSYERGGSVYWTSPELFCPEKFGLKNFRKTRSSDCYAFGMTVYEVLSGRVPFYNQHGYGGVSAVVLGGGRPMRPQGEAGRWFTDAVWGILEHCWTPEPSNRPSISYVLECLDKASDLWTPFSPLAVDLQITDLPAWTPTRPSNEGSMTVTHFSPA